MTSEELKALVRQLQDDNIEVFDSIYYETKNVVYYSILNILKDPSISEDIMQDTYLKMLEKIHTYKPRSDFKSWVVTIARNLAINEYNKRKREFKIDPQSDEYIFGSVDDNSEQKMIMEELLDKLKEQEREVVILHVIGDLKHREIASILNKPIGTITWMYKEAIKKIKNEYESR